MKSMHYLLFYEAAEDYGSRRTAFREAHLNLALGAVVGELVPLTSRAETEDDAVDR